MPVLVDDLHLVRDPHARMRRAVADARAGSRKGRAGTLVVRCPDRDARGLHAIRLDDVAELLHEHARIREIGTTDGGTIVASADVCRRRGSLAIWTGHAIGPWHPSDIVQRGLGGSETAAVRLAENLAAMGWTVTLYGQFDSAGMCGDVMLRHFRTFDPSRPLHVLVGFRDAALFDRRPNARWCGLWLEDLAPAERLTPDRANNIDRVCTVSRWHKNQVLREHPWLDADQVTACRNGIATGWYRERPAPERERRVVYSSSPDRGGDIVLECWPEILRQVPDAQLILTYPRWFEICADTFQLANDHREKLRRLVDQPGVRRLEEGMGQKSLAGLLRSSMVWVNPGYYTPGGLPFDETSCISAMEAQAAGLVVVASNWGAVTETVRHGTLIDGNPADPAGAWREQFVHTVVRGLTDPVLQAAARECGPAAVKNMDWRGAAEQLAGLFPARRPNANLGAIYP